MYIDKIKEATMGISNEYSDYLSCSNLHLMPERKLFCAVLERAILDLLSDSTKLQLAAEEWFNEPLSERPELCTFQHICQELDLDPTKLKEKIISQKLKVETSGR